MRNMLWVCQTEKWLKQSGYIEKGGQGVREEVG